MPKKVTMSAAEFAAREDEFPAGEFDFYWNRDFTRVTVTFPHAAAAVFDDECDEADYEDEDAILTR